MANHSLHSRHTNLSSLLLFICTLFIVAASGTTPTLAEPQRIQVAPERVGRYVISADSQWVVYQVIDGISTEGFIFGPVYSQRLGGSERTKLSDAEYAVDIDISPDNSRVLLHERYPSLKELQIVPIKGGTPLSLSQPGERVAYGGYKFSPDGQWVVYPTEAIGLSDIQNKGTLYSVPVTGGDPVLLGDTAIYFGFSNQNLLFSGDSRYVVTIDPVLQVIYRIPIGGGPRLNLSPVITLSLSSSDLHVIGDTLVYVSKDVGSTYYSASISTGTFQEMASFPSGYYAPPEIILSADGLWGIFLVNHYIAWESDAIITELYSAKLDGSARVKLGESPVNGRINGIITPDSTHVVVTLATTNTWMSSGPMLIIPIGGGVARQIASSVVRPYGFDKAGSHVIFQYPINLASIPLTGGAAKILNIAPSAGQKIVWTQISPDKEWVLYTLGTGEGDPPNMDSLYSVPINGGSSRRIDDTLMSSPGYFDFQFTPDSLKIAFTSSAGHLFVVRDAQQLLRAGDRPLYYSYQPLLGRG